MLDRCQHHANCRGGHQLRVHHRIGHHSDGGACVLRGGGGWILRRKWERVRGNGRERFLCAGRRAHCVSSSAALNFTSCISSTYDDYAIRVLGMQPATGGVKIGIQMSSNGGSTIRHNEWTLLVASARCRTKHIGNQWQHIGHAGEFL